MHSNSNGDGILVVVFLIVALLILASRSSEPRTGEPEGQDGPYSMTPMSP
jgi:hypothetical protein